METLRDRPMDRELGGQTEQENMQIRLTQSYWNLELYKNAIISGHYVMPAMKNCRVGRYKVSWIRLGWINFGCLRVINVRPSLVRYRRAKPGNIEGSGCLKIIFGTDYTSYSMALENYSLENLSYRREDRCLQFGLKCIVHPVHKRMFPINPQLNNEMHFTRNQEHFQVNMAKLTRTRCQQSHISSVNSMNT